MLIKKVDSLQDVDLEDFVYPCIKYSLLRTGSTKSIQDILDDKGIPYEGIDALTVGDILVWRKENTERRDTTTHINKYGVVTTRAFSGIHVGVYEGDGLVSDLVFNDSYIPSIRMMHVNDGARPNIVIK